MTSETTVKMSSRFKRLATLGLFVALSGLASTAGATYSVPENRSVQWQGNVGVLNDIPARGTIFTTLNPSGGDDTSAIQAAISNCPADQVVALAAGTFNVSSPIVVKSGITLRGAGMGATVIKGSSGMSGAYIVGMDAGMSTGTSVSLSGNQAKGSATITTSTPHNWNVGTLVLIDQENNPQGDPAVTNTGNNGTCTWCGRENGNRSLGQIAKVTAVPDSTTATLEIPLYWNYDSGMSPQATPLSGITENAGIEDLTVDNSLSGSPNQSDNGGTIVLSGTSNCWLLRVEGICSYQNMVRIRAAYRNTIRSCKFHDGFPAAPANGSQYTPGRSYGFFVNPYASANLFEDNQVYHLLTGFMLNGATSGNVFAYNYITELYCTVQTWNQGPFTFHGSHPMMNLMEGNYTDGRLVADAVWGSSSHNTFFRNRHMLAPNKTGAPWDVDLQANSNYYTLVGNVFGTAGTENMYEFMDAVLTGQAAVYRLGYTGDGDGDPSGNDAQVDATVLRHGNWDSTSNTAVWDGTDDQTLPPSLYLTAKPGWWGSMQWPAIGPDVSPMYPAAPGAGNGTPWG